MRSLSGKVAWITGAGSGIGRAAAVALGGAGMVCVLSGRRAGPLEETALAVGAAGGQARVHVLDVTDADAVAVAGAAIVADFGGVDVLVNSAGSNVTKRSWAEVDRTGWDEVIALNLNAAYACCAAALPSMRARGDGLIVNVASWAGRYPSRLTGPAYNASKAGLIAMTQSINLEEFSSGIRACALSPGEVATPILDKRPVPVSDDDKARMLQAEDLGETILFLARLPARACVNELVISPTWNRLA